MSGTSGTPYTVQAGDTLFSIAQKMLGNGNLYTEIRNPDGTTPDPTQLQPGYVLWLPAATAPASPGSRGIFFADVDGDGRADAIVVNDNTITVRRSTGNGFGPNEDWTGFPFYANKGTYFADVDGDGRADAIVVNDNTITVRRSTGNGFGPDEDWTRAVPSSGGVCASGTPYTVQPGDTLFSIAQKMLGNGNLYTEIRNPDGTTPNPTQLQPGQVLCLPSAPTPGGSGFASIVSHQTYNTIFPNRNALYTYHGLIAATRAFPLFCNDGTSQQNLQEAAAFLANISHETGALVFVDEQNPPSIYCDASNTTYPCATGQSYHGRGPMQLSWNYNYGACGSAIGKDLLNQPELVSTHSTISFTTALWFWMTAQPPKPSCHDAIRSSGFGMTINVINGGIECGQPTPTPQALDRIQLYQQYCGMLGVDPGGNLQC